jgi:cyclopropane fatty-acyl-phospholipid synthase-like methyltransferase
MGKKKLLRDKHILYEASVQAVESDLDFAERVYKRRNGKRPVLLREDFCGTAALACAWVQRRPHNRAWGVDIHGPTLDWCRTIRIPLLGEAAHRLSLLQRDVREVREPRVDVLLAQNFSYWIFKQREGLRSYFETVRASLRNGGVFIVDVFGGTDSMKSLEEDRKVRGERAPDGTTIPDFTYIWQQAHFNPIDHHILCHIHFKLPKGKKIRKAFSYDWRLWTLPELRELMAEAGFVHTDVYNDGWDEQRDEPDGVYRRRTYFENDLGWVAYIVAHA